MIIRLDAHVEKRKKKLSKAIYSTSHIISLDEAKYVYEKGAERLIVGTGQSDMANYAPTPRHVQRAYGKQKKRPG